MLDLLQIKNEKILKRNEIYDYAVSLRTELRDKIKERYEEVTSIFEKNGLRSFAMKTFRSYPYLDDDIDMVLVDNNRRNEYIALLERAGYKFRFNISMLREPGKAFFVKADNNGNLTRPVIHVHYAVSWNGITCLDAEEVYRRLRKANVMGMTVKLPSYEDEFLIMAAHSIYENTYLTMGELLHIKNIKEESKRLDVDYMIGMARKYNWQNSLKEYMGYTELCYNRIMDGEIPPFFIPSRSLLKSYAAKVAGDVLSMNIRALPRELLTFCLVIWLYRFKKIVKFKKENPE